MFVRFDPLYGFVNFFFRFFRFRVVESVDDFRLLVVDRRLDGSQARRMHRARVLDDVFAECVMQLVARRRRPPSAVRSPCRSSQDPRDFR